MQWHGQTDLWIYKRRTMMDSLCEKVERKKRKRKSTLLHVGRDVWFRLKGIWVILIGRKKNYFRKRLSLHPRSPECSGLPTSPCIFNDEGDNWLSWFWWIALYERWFVVKRLVYIYIYIGPEESGFCVKGINETLEFYYNFIIFHFTLFRWG